MINKMKNIIKITVLSMLLATLTVSCNDEFLERYPLATISSGSFFSDVISLRMYANNWYNQNDLLPLYNTYNLGPFQEDACYGYFEGQVSWGIGTDVQVYQQYSMRLNGEWTVREDGYGFWTRGHWELLRNINYFMDQYTAVKAPFDDVKQYVGEAHFFRSLFYFDKLRRFGDVPYASYLIDTDSEILYAPRTPRNQVVDSIMRDLDLAKDYIPAKGNGAWTGRVTKETVMALQARIALYEGTWEKYHNGTPFAAAENKSQHFLQKAADVAGELIALEESAGYPALDGVGDEFGYRDLFNRVETEYESSKEVLFWRRAMQGVWIGHWAENSPGGGGTGATKSMIDSYLKLDGTPVAPGYDDATLVKVAEGRDPRLSQSICIDDGNHYRFQLGDQNLFVAPAFDGMGCPTGYQVYKGHNFRVPQQNTRENAFNALIYFRYGETLLIYAEAKAELGQINQNDLDRSINKLRRRAGMPDLTTGVAIDPNFEFASLPPIIQAIRRERKVELAFEGFRSNDIMRWAAADELVVGMTPLGAKKAQWEGFKFDESLNPGQSGRQDAFDTEFADLVTDANGYIKPHKNFLNGGTEGYKFKVNRDYLLPIPQNQTASHLNPNLGQNPGW